MGFFFDEELDRRFLNCFRNFDFEGLKKIDERSYQSGTSEVKLYVPILVAMSAVRDAPRALPVAGLVLLAAAALGNAGLGAYHAGVEWGLWQGPTDCTGSIGGLGSAGGLLDRLDSVKVIRCDEVQWRFLGISLAGYNVLISLVMAAVAAWGVIRSARASRR